MTKLKNIWVFAEKQQNLNELCAGAAQFGEKVSVIWAGSKELACSADVVYYLGELDNKKVFENYIPTIIRLIKDNEPDMFLVDTSKNGRLIAGAVAAVSKTSVLTDINEIELFDDGVQTKRMVYGGAAFKTEKITHGLVIVCIPVGVFKPNIIDIAGNAKIISVDFVPPAVSVECIEKRPKIGETVDLRLAKRVVGVGRGFPNEKSLSLAYDFADAVNAEVGCTRPVAEEEKWFAKERYLGISGTMIKPDIYFGIGVSGQVQHMVGVNQAHTIVAVNKDKNAPIFKQADYGIVGDLKNVIPELLALIKR
ncbi:FAD-binding protein [Pectinatus frisingensis]|uniref:FAD-binding protein n=1 Tax=Pectinatus frisingensis TaxID=865 RepID=UPI0015F558DD|nr:FAD-binding protein [Pectinatus frisingensis]